MKYRCSCPRYRHYAGRGITVEEEWLDFRGFALFGLQRMAPVEAPNRIPAQAGVVTRRFR
jgi:hypothetical protein